jgi:hypothetical protein
MKFFARFFRTCWFIIIPLLLVGSGATVMLCMGIDKARVQWFVTLGPVFIMAVTVGYIVAIDSRNRWPNATWRERFIKLFTYEK